MLAHVAMTRARARPGALLARASRGGPHGALADLPRRPRGRTEPRRRSTRRSCSGPAEGLHSTYRMLRDEVLEASWRAGSAVSEMRLDTVDDVNRAVARYLELVKLAALIQRPGAEPAPEAIEAINELLGRVASPGAADGDRGLVAGRVRARRGARARRPPRPGRGAARAVAGAVPAAAQGRPRALGLRHRPLPDLPAEVQVRPRLRDPAGADDQPALRDPDPPGARALPRRGDARRVAWRSSRTRPRPAASSGCWALFEAGWRRQGFGASDDELQYRDRAVAALARYHERHQRSESRPVWLERNFAFAIGPHQLRGRVDRVDRATRRRLRADRLQDRRPRLRPEADRRRAARALPARRPRGLADRGRAPAATGTCSPTSGSRSAPEPDDAERVERTVLEVAGGITEQDFEPRPSHEICSWCDYRLICPASEA